MFTNEDFPKDVEYLTVYRNIKKSVLYYIATKSAIFSYKDVIKWVYSHLDPNTTTIFKEA
jgi:hypothetical protein